MIGFDSPDLGLVARLLDEGRLPNLAALKFREHEGSFLVGAIAGLVTRTKIVGFVGGMKIPLIRKFEAGYEAGVKHVCPTCRVLSAYAGTEPKAFADPAHGQELGAAQYGQGADIIFHASGSTGLGVFEAGRELKKLAIGVDSDQYDEAPGVVLTSMVKHVEVAVFNTVRDLREVLKPIYFWMNVMKWGAIGIAAFLVVEKCGDSIPICRIEKRFERLGIPMSRPTMNEIAHAVAEFAAETTSPPPTLDASALTSAVPAPPPVSFAVRTTTESFAVSTG